MPGDAPAGWSGWQRRLHWWVAALVVAAFVLAFLMVAVPRSALLEKFLLYQLHKTLGLTVAGLVIARLALRLRLGRPGWETWLPEWRRHAATLVHGALYCLVLAVPVLGYLTAASAPASVPTLFLFVIPVPHVIGPDKALFDVLRPLHRAAAIALVSLATLHAAVALHDHLKGRPTLRRMWRAPREACAASPAEAQR